jgi:hypothetical protein
VILVLVLVWLVGGVVLVELGGGGYVGVGGMVFGEGIYSGRLDGWLFSAGVSMWLERASRALEDIIELWLWLLGWVSSRSSMVVGRPGT